MKSKSIARTLIGQDKKESTTMFNTFKTNEIAQLKANYELLLEFNNFPYELNQAGWHLAIARVEDASMQV
jgi:hypothetical protein